MNQKLLELETTLLLYGYTKKRIKSAIHPTHFNQWRCAVNGPTRFMNVFYENNNPYVVMSTQFRNNFSDDRKQSYSEALRTLIKYESRS